MIIYEIEDMETNESVYVQAPTEQAMKDGLKEKGFTDVQGMFFAGRTAEGHEVSAMEAEFPGLSHLKPLPITNNITP
jgi:hypothetical protein